MKNGSKIKHGVFLVHASELDARDIRSSFACGELCVHVLSPTRTRSHGRSSESSHGCRPCEQRASRDIEINCGEAVRSWGLVEKSGSEVSPISGDTVDEGDENEEVADDERDCALSVRVSVGSDIWRHENKGGTGRTSISAVAPPRKEAVGMMYEVCTALTTLTKILVEKTERSMMRSLEGSLTRQSRRNGRTTRMISDTVSAKKREGGSSEQAKKSSSGDKRTTDFGDRDPVWHRAFRNDGIIPRLVSDTDNRFGSEDEGPHASEHHTSAKGRHADTPGWWDDTDHREHDGQTGKPY